MLSCLDFSLRIPSLRPREAVASGLSRNGVRHRRSSSLSTSQNGTACTKKFLHVVYHGPFVYLLPIGRTHGRPSREVGRSNSTEGQEDIDANYEDTIHEPPVSVMKRSNSNLSMERDLIVERREDLTSMKDIITKENESTVGNQNPGSLSNPDTANSVAQKTEVGVVDDDQLKNAQEVEQSKEHALGLLKETNLDYRITAEEHELESYNQSQNFLLNFDTGKNGQLDSTHSLTSSDSFGQSTETVTINNDKGLTNSLEDDHLAQLKQKSLEPYTLEEELDSHDQSKFIPFLVMGDTRELSRKSASWTSSDNYALSTHADVDDGEKLMKGLEAEKSTAEVVGEQKQRNVEQFIISEKNEPVSYNQSQDSMPKHDMDIDGGLEKPHDFLFSSESFAQSTEASIDDDLIQMKQADYQQSQYQTTLPFPSDMSSSDVIDENVHITAKFNIHDSDKQQQVLPEVGNLSHPPLAGTSVANVIFPPEQHITTEQDEPVSYNQGQDSLTKLGMDNEETETTYDLLSYSSSAQSSKAGVGDHDELTNDFVIGKFMEDAHGQLNQTDHLQSQPHIMLPVLPGMHNSVLMIDNNLDTKTNMDGSDGQQEVPSEEGNISSSPLTSSSVMDIVGLPEQYMIPEEAAAVSYSESQDSQSKLDTDIYELERSHDFSSSFDNFVQSNEVGVSDDDEPRNHLEIENSTSHDLQQLQETNVEQSQPQIILPALPDPFISDAVVDYNLEFTGETDLPISDEQQDVPPEEGNLDSLPLAGPNVMNVIVVAAECTPWSKTGIYIHFNFETNLEGIYSTFNCGLGDVVGDLPKALARRGHRVMVVVPKYGNYSELKELGVLRRYKADGQDLEVTYHHAYIDFVDFVFIDSPVFRHIGNDIYGGHWQDILKRMILFCKAAVEVPWYVPCGGSCYGDGNLVFIANDWHTALLPVYLKAYYRNNGLMIYTRCVLVIHNIAHQGRCPLDDFARLDLPGHYMDLFELYDPVGGEHLNIFAAGLKCADQVVTVSHGYSWELKTSEGGWGLHGIINEIGWKFRGIVNGINTQTWNPNFDVFLTSDGYTNYNLETLRVGKPQCKAALQRELGLPVRDDAPIFAFIGRLDGQKGIDLIEDAMPWLVGQDLQLVMLGTGRRDLEDMLRRFQAQYPNKVRGWVGFSDKMAHRITAGADVLLMPSKFEPCGLNQLYAMMYGTVPVVHAVGGLRDTVKQFDPFRDTGLGWTFEKAEANRMIDAIAHCLNTYRNYKECWKELQMRGMVQDFTWDNAAQLYEQVLVAAKYQW
ncbi:hypothetical protein ZIOFF_042924 [Zingiber officinale]|uniref:starch synthase n=1 Tax=Zingiber officinale TaxID=94328 RepID=A0A8J5G2J3_ZINOF|nr:hypothetical protein ZIOFF_042924 [Zingiber officinale]